MRFLSEEWINIRIIKVHHIVYNMVDYIFASIVVWGFNVKENAVGNVLFFFLCLSFRFECVVPTDSVG